MRRISEKSLVVVLFVLVLITFALAQEDTRKMEKAFFGLSTTASPAIVSIHDTFANDSLPEPPKE
jgi:hypothetical protein